MKLANFSSDEFVDQTVLNSAETLTRDSLLDITGGLHTAGLIGASNLSFSYSGLNITVSAPLPFRALFSDGTLASANGTVDGESSSSATVDFSSLVPSTGSITAYLVAVSGSVMQEPYQIVGPPVGHPDFSSSFSPYTAYSEAQDTLQFQATTTEPNNTDTLFIASTVLSAGQATITSSSTTGQVRAGAILSRNGEVLAADLGSGAAATNVGTLGGSLVGTLPNPTLASTGATSGTYINPISVTVDSDGRISSISNVDDYDVPGNLTVGDSATVSGELTASTAQINGVTTISMIGGDGGMLLLADTTSGQTTPNKSIRSDGGDFQIINSAYSQTILNLTDSGDLSVPGTFNAGNTGVGSLTASSAQINGNATITGTATVSGATSSGQAVNLSQVANAAPVQAVAASTTATSLTATTGTFTAPSNGWSDSWSCRFRNR